MKKWKSIILGIVLLLVISACSAGYVESEPSYSESPRPQSPNASYIWINGNWEWGNNHYTHRNGYWEKPRKGRTYTQGHWDHGNKGHHWTKGKWN